MNRRAIYKRDEEMIKRISRGMYEIQQCRNREVDPLPLMDLIQSFCYLDNKYQERVIEYMSKLFHEQLEEYRAHERNTKN